MATTTVTRQYAVPNGFTDGFIATQLRSLDKAFVHPQNIEYLIWQIEVRNTTDGRPIDRNLIITRVPTLASKFSEDNALNDFESLTHNWLETLNYINQQFIGQTYTQLKGGGWTSLAVERGEPEPDANMFHAEIGGVLGQDALVDDYRELDAYNYSRDVVVANDRPYRNNNKIHGWERQLNVRNYDYHDTEGFRDTRDLEVPQRGYDMTAIHRIATTYDRNPAVRNPPPAIKQHPGYGESRYEDWTTWD